MSAKRLSKTEIKALLTLWDYGPSTSGALGITPSVILNLVRYGLVSRKEKRPLTYVGKSLTLYSLTKKGRVECVLTGKRFEV